MKIFDFFRNYMGKMVGAVAEIFDKLEPEPEPKILTSWSRSRTKMDRLRNTAHNTPPPHRPNLSICSLFSRLRNLKGKVPREDFRPSVFFHQSTPPRSLIIIDSALCRIAESCDSVLCCTVHSA
jgi:hypothetical protein